jgi:endonuclease G
MSQRSRAAVLQATALILIALYFFLWALHGFAHAQEGSKCPEHYLGGATPVFQHEKVTARSVELCSIAFAVLHSPLSKGPLYSAEHLTAQALADAPARDNAFHADPRLTHGDRAEMADYDHSGFDRGHMTPSGDAGSAEAQQETFALSNMVPQNPHNNRLPWRLLEEKIRKQTLADGELWIVTGPLFVGDTVQAIGKSKVLVPTHLFKAVYDPAKGTSVVYVVLNKDDPDMHLLTVPVFTQTYAIDPFPGLPSKPSAAAQ